MYRRHKPIGHSVLCFILLASCQFVTLPARSQVGTTVSGLVDSSANEPVIGATVSLISTTGHAIVSTTTDSSGQFAFRSVEPGEYRLHAASKIGAAGDSARFSVQNSESRTMNVTVLPPATSGTSTPDFFDRPTFTVAGVTDTTNLGGHGSDTITRTKESLAKEVTGLQPGNKRTAPDSASENAALDKANRNQSDFDANYSAGTLLLANGKPSEAITYLKRARDLRPTHIHTNDALAQALTATGDYAEARKVIAAQIPIQDRAELHNLLATIEEHSGNPLQAEQQYQIAAKLEPNEQNMFDWGAELLLHHAPEPATEVFSEGVRRFPASSRMLTALGVAWYIRGSYEQAAVILERASDLDPQKPTPYLFLGHILAAEASYSEAAAKRLERFLAEFPQDPRANYLAALSIWKRAQASQDNAALERAQQLLARATELDPNFALAYLQRGIVCTELQDTPSAVSALQRAAELNPTLADAHYRLSLLYRRSGDDVNATRELALYRQSTASAQAQEEHERHEIQQFVIKSHEPPTQQ